MFAYTDLREELESYLTESEIAQISEAYAIAAQAHEGQYRASGEPYVSHPLAVAKILAGLKMDADCIIAAVLHDVIEDTPVNKGLIAEKFGNEVADLVDGVSKLTQITFEDKAKAQAENFRKMMWAMAKDMRVILIKLADRLHNMRTLGSLPQAKIIQKAKETLEIYAPIAHRMGMNQFKTEFEDLSFAALHPWRYKILKEALRKTRKNKHKTLVTMEKAVHAQLKAWEIACHTVEMRHKSLYSIYKKMKNKGVDFSDVMDVQGFRIIVQDLSTCYRVLGCIHQLYRPLVARFKDYIAIPKANGYQSLHTTVLGPLALPVEFQIRTVEMHEIAEQGVAAHCVYKGVGLKQGGWFKNLLRLEKHTKDSLEFIDSVKVNLDAEEEIYVFTPAGKIIALPEGACALDFAYAVHTDIGQHTVACKIDRQLSPLSMRLRSGQTVEIVTVAEAHPSPAWLGFVRTGKARIKVRQWLKKQMHEDAVVLGQRWFTAVLEKFSLTEAMKTDLEWHTFLVEQGFKNKTELYRDIGLGKRLALAMALRLFKENISVAAPEVFTLEGTEGYVLSYATCCTPIPGDDIVGLIHPGSGIEVHRQQCALCHRTERIRERLIGVSWSAEMGREFLAKIVVEVVNGRGVLAQLSAAFADAQASIVNLKVDLEDGNHHRIHWEIMVKDTEHLAQIFKRLQHCDSVLQIAREDFEVGGHAL